MSLAIFIFYVLYFLSGMLILIGVFKQFTNEAEWKKKSKSLPTIDLENLTVIIPFRNERERITRLIHSINTSDKLPAEFIFVDDHSDDETHELIKSLLIDIPYKVIQSISEGKKRALEQGISLASTEMILTFDADVKFSKNYFTQLEKLVKVDMLVLPVLMQGKSWKRIFEMDVDLAGVANCASTGLGYPILASGANLVFSKVAYLKYANLDEHAHIASGDDVFLLNNFKKNNCEIHLITNPKVAVRTDVPGTLKEYLNQRLRWLGKTTVVNDKIATFIAFIQFCFTIFFWILIIKSAVDGQYDHVLQLFFIKWSIDSASTIFYFNRIGKTQRYLEMIVYQFWMPILSFVLLVGMFLIRPKWKGRLVR